MSEQVDRLPDAMRRKAAMFKRTVGPNETQLLLLQAADLIESQQQRISELEAEVRHWRDEAHAYEAWRNERPVFERDLAARVAAISKVRDSARAGLEDCDEDYEMSAQWVYETLSDTSESVLAEVQAAAFDEGVRAHSLRVAQKLLALLPQGIEVTNRYREEQTDEQ